jgi:dihydrofolate reductase
MVKRDSIHFIYYFASSCDGFIADVSGGVEWLNAFHGGVDYGANDLFKSFDGAVMGRKTYEQALTFGKWQFSAKMPCVVLSKTRTSGPHVDFWPQHVEGLREYFRKKGAKNVWMVGGGAAATSFLNAGLLTDIRQAVMPIVLGSGIPAYGPLEKHVRLKLADSKEFSNGVVALRYTPV